MPQSLRLPQPCISQFGGFQAAALAATTWGILQAQHAASNTGYIWQPDNDKMHITYT
jgi:hypothetical protein